MCDNFMECFRCMLCACPMGTSAFRGDYSVLQACNTKWSNMSCEECNLKFNLLRRKRTCCGCGHNYCMSCIRKLKGVEKPIQCHRCRVFCSVPIDRELVMGLRVRDLLWFLESHNIPVHGCKEKTDLVNLVMHYATLRNASFAYPQNYERHTLGPEVHNEVESEESSPVFSHRNLSQQQTLPTPGVPDIVEVHESESDGFTVITLPMHGERLPHEEEQAEVPEQEERSGDVNIEDSKEEESRSNVEEQSFTPLSVDDITSVEQIMNLSVMQLKLILTRNFIGFKGCCEKQELQSKVRQLWEQKQGAKSYGEIPDENLCKICMEAAIDSVLLDCGHVVTCTECGKRLHECPICRQYVVRVVHIFKA